MAKRGWLVLAVLLAAGSVVAYQTRASWYPDSTAVAPFTGLTEVPRLTVARAQTAQWGLRGIMAGMLIGQVYRFKVSNIKFREGEEVFPTIEVIDRHIAKIAEITGNHRHVAIGTDFDGNISGFSATFFSGMMTSAGLRVAGDSYFYDPARGNLLLDVTAVHRPDAAPPFAGQRSGEPAELPPAVDLAAGTAPAHRDDGRDPAAPRGCRPCRCERRFGFPGPLGRWQYVPRLSSVLAAMTAFCGEFSPTTYARWTATSSLLTPCRPTDSWNRPLKPAPWQACCRGAGPR